MEEERTKGVGKEERGYRDSRKKERIKGEEGRKGNRREATKDWKRWPTEGE